MSLLRNLYVEGEGLAAAVEMPEALADLYGGGLALSEDAVYANFVSSLDGVVSLGGRRGSGSTISGRDGADRFVMGLLRALADAVLVGAGTLRTEGGQPWSPRWISPAHADAYASLDRPDPLLVVATASVRDGHPGRDHRRRSRPSAGAAPGHGPAPRAAGRPA